MSEKLACFVPGSSFVRRRIIIGLVAILTLTAAAVIGLAILWPRLSALIIGGTLGIIGGTTAFIGSAKSSAPA